MHKYYDTKSKSLYDLPSFTLDSSNIGTIYKTENSLTVDASNFSMNYVKEMINEAYELSGHQNLKKGYVRDIIIMRESGELIELKNCILNNVYFGDEFLNNDSKYELEFNVDLLTIHTDKSDAYYDIIRAIREDKISNILD